MGFSMVGFARAEFMIEESERLNAWLDKSYHGSMTYMENNIEKRCDPGLLFEGAKSIICLAYNYFTESECEGGLKVSKYAYGRDYHKVLKKKMNSLIKSINENIVEINARAFVDSAPVLERDWARRSGIGWMGKNTMIINPKKGSFFFLAEIICDLELEYDAPIDDYCGTCTKCIEACPTDAISQDGYILDGSKCISYLTIENKDVIPNEFKGKMENWVFGCDICQDVCPWNRFAVEHEEPDFEKREYVDFSKNQWSHIKAENFHNIFNGTPVMRAKYSGIERNVRFILGDE